MVIPNDLSRTPDTLPPAPESLRLIVDAPAFLATIRANARIILLEHRAYAARTHQPHEWLLNDLTTHVWVRRWKYDPARAGVATWAKMNVRSRLRDLVRSQETLKSQKLTITPHIPERPTPTKSQLSVTRKPDMESRLAALAYIARHLAAATIPPRSPKDRSPFADAQLAAILVVKLDRHDTLRGVVFRVQHSASLRDELDLEGAIPSWMALWRASLRCWGTPGKIDKLLRESLAKMGELEQEMR